MDEDLAIVNTSTRNEKIKNFFITNKKNLIIVFSLILLILVGYFGYKEFKSNNKIKLGNRYNVAIIKFTSGEKINVKEELENIVNKKDKTYSPLALYFLIDNQLLNDQTKINSLFDILINETDLDFEIQNLIIYKKALFNSNFVDENELINILNPIINKESLWKSHALYLLGEYFFSKGEKQKAKEFYNQILILSNSNPDIKLRSQKRLNRDLSE